MRKVLFLITALFITLCIQAQTSPLLYQPAQTTPQDSLKFYVQIGGAMRFMYLRDMVDAPTLSTISDLRAYNRTATVIHVADTMRGGEFNIYPPFPQLTPDSGIVFKLNDGRYAIRNTTQSNGIHTKWFGLTGDGTDESVKMQAAVNLTQALKWVLYVDKRTTYKVNVRITGQINLEGNFAGFVPATNAPVFYIDKGSQQAIFSNINSILTNVDRSWTNADFIYLDGNARTQDNTTFNNVVANGGPAFGFYGAGEGIHGHTIQSLQLNHCRFFRFAYAGFRLEGGTFESGADYCFFNQNGQAGANPAITDQTTYFTASPSRAFHRGNVELLRWHNAADSAKGQNVSNRFVFKNCNFVPSDSAGVRNGANYRIAGVYVEGGTGLAFINCNNEFSHPAYWFAKPPTTNEGDYTQSSNGVIIEGGSIYSKKADVLAPYAQIIYNGFRNLTINGVFFKGAGGVNTEGLILCDWDGTKNIGVGPLHVVNCFKTGYDDDSVNTQPLTGKDIVYTPTAYAATFSIPNANAWKINMQGDYTRVVRTSPGQFLDVINADNILDGQMISISCLINVGGALPMRNNSLDSLGNQLKGRLYLNDASQLTLDDPDKTITFRYFSFDSAWHEIGKDFVAFPRVGIYGNIADIDASSIKDGVYNVTSTTAGTKPPGFGNAVGIFEIYSTNPKGISYKDSTFSFIERITRANTNKMYVRSYNSSTHAFSNWEDSIKAFDVIMSQNNSKENKSYWVKTGTLDSLTISANLAVGDSSKFAPNSATVKQMIAAAIAAGSTGGTGTSTSSPTFISLTTDATTTSGTAVDIVGSDASTLSLAVGANKKYKVHIELKITSGGTGGGLKFGLTAPSGAAIKRGSFVGSSTTAAGAQMVDVPASFGGLTATAFLRAALSGGLVKGDIFITTGNTAGTLRLQFAAFTAGDTITVLSGSTMDAVEEQ